MNDQNLRHDPLHQANAARLKHSKALPNPLKQILAMQANLYRIAIDTNLDPKHCAQASLAWERLEERKRILKGRPMPGSLKPESPKAKRRVASVVEPTELP
jgi:hypothetical protein